MATENIGYYYDNKSMCDEITTITEDLEIKVKENERSIKNLSEELSDKLVELTSQVKTTEEAVDEAKENLSSQIRLYHSDTKDAYDNIANNLKSISNDFSMKIEEVKEKNNILKVVVLASGIVNAILSIIILCVK